MAVNEPLSLDESALALFRDLMDSQREYGRESVREVLDYLPPDRLADLVTVAVVVATGQEGTRTPDRRSGRKRRAVEA